MNYADQQRWDRKYSEKVAPEEIQADPFLERCLPGIAAGRSLDIACGLGDNAIAMARNGFEVTAIDLSGVGLERARERARTAGVAVDFKRTDVEDFDLPLKHFDLITSFYFLNRAVFPKIKKGLKEGGIYLTRTYTREELRYRPNLNPAYLLEPGELRETFRDFEILLYEEKDNGREGKVEMIARRA